MCAGIVSNHRHGRCPGGAKGEALFYRGVTYEQRGDMEQALADYTAVIDMADAPAEQKAMALVNRGATYGQRGDVEQALADYTAVIDMADAPAEQKAMALFNRGVTYKQRGDMEQALADYTAVIDMADAPAEQKAMALFNRGVDLQAAGRHGAGTGGLHGCHRHGRCPGGAKGEGALQSRCDLRSSGVTWSRHWRTTRPSSTWPMPRRSKRRRRSSIEVSTYGQRGDMEQALADYTAVIDMADAPAEQKAKALVNRGVTFGQRGDMEQALADYTAVIDMADAPAEQKAMALFNRGVTQWQLGQFGPAQQSYRTAPCYPGCVVAAEDGCFVCTSGSDGRRCKSRSGHRSSRICVPYRRQCGGRLRRNPG